METWKDEKTNSLCNALLSLNNLEECYAFLEDICTINELLEMSKRLEVAKLLTKGKSYQEIIKATGASTATIGRNSKCLGFGNGGYKTVIARLEK